MTFNKTSVAILVATMLSSSVLYASPFTTAEVDEIKTSNVSEVDFPHPEHYLNFPQFIIPVLSGDGKTLLINTLGNGEAEGAIFYGEGYSNKHKIGAGAFGVLMPSISEDGSIAIADEVRFNKFENGQWNEHQLQNGDLIIGVAGNGAIYSSSDNPLGSLPRDPSIIYRLRDPQNPDNIIREINAGTASLTQVNHDGSVWLFNNNNTQYNSDSALVYYGNNLASNVVLDFSEVVDPEHFFPSLSYPLEANALMSPDGKVVYKGGWGKAILYSGQDYGVKSEISGHGKNVFLYASNYDGSVLGGAIGRGWANTYPRIGFNGEELDSLGFPLVDMRPIIWYGTNWQQSKDVGTLGGKVSDGGVIYSMSYDGSVMSGMSANAEGKYVPTLWRVIKNPKPEPVPQPEPTPEIKPEEPSVIILDPNKTKETIAKVGLDSFKAMEFQRYGLISLLKGCDVEQGEGHYCVSLRSGLSGQGKSRDVRVGVSAAYKFTDNLSAGFVVEHSVYNRLQASYGRAHNNIGVGLYAEWKHKADNSEFYIRPAVSFSRYNMDVQRQALVGTEFAEGNTKLKGRMLSLTLGQEHKLNEDKLGWFLGVRHGKIAQKGFSDNAQGFPISYDKMTYKDTALFAGVNYNKAVTDKLNWLSSIEVEQRIHQDNPTFRAYNPYLGEVKLDHKMPKTALTLASGVEYKMNDTFRVSLMPSITKAYSSQLYWNVGLNLTGQF
ncbi:autotransporter domain-containing protein [Pasteurellaceae bacterium 22721_9_1]